MMGIFTPLQPSAPWNPVEPCCDITLLWENLLQFGERGGDPDYLDHDTSVYGVSFQ